MRASRARVASRMIAQVSGTLVGKELDRVEIMTAGGVGYELAIPLGVYETLPKVGEPVALHTHLVVKEDAGSSSASRRRSSGACFSAC